MVPRASVNPGVERIKQRLESLSADLKQTTEAAQQQNNSYSDTKIELEAIKMSYGGFPLSPQVVE